MHTEKIKQIRFVGKAKAIDFAVDSEEHNFFANGVAVSNSHAFSYSAVTAAEFWLKHNFPVQFMAAVLSNTKAHHKKHGSENILADYINYCRRKGYKVLPPDVNESEVAFTVEGEKIDLGIRYSLGHIKNLGTCAADVRQNAPYESIADMYERVPRRRVTKRVIESLIKAGAFDSLYKECPDIAEKRNTAMEDYYKLRRNKKDVLKAMNIDGWKEAEREMLGVVLSVPPLCKEFEQMVKEKKWCSIADAPSKNRANVFGRIDKVVNTVAKSSGRQMLIVEISDDIDSLSFYVFENSMKKFGDEYRIGHIVAIPLNKFEDGGRRFFDVHKEGVVIKEG